MVVACLPVGKEVEVDGRITKIDPRKDLSTAEGGYKFSGENYDNCRNDYALIEFYWNKVSDHYVISEADRKHQYFSNRPIKPLFGPILREVLEPDRTNADADQRCLELLLDRLKRGRINAVMEVKVV